MESSNRRFTRSHSVEIQPLNKRNLDEALESLYQRIKRDTASQVALLEEQNRNLKTLIERQNSDIQSMKTAINNLATECERMSRKERIEFAVINGVDEATKDVVAWVQKLCEILNLRPDTTFKPMRLGKKPNSTRRIKVKFMTEKDKRYAVDKCKELFSNEDEAKRLLPNQQKLFINYDESPMTRRENARLREKRRSLIRKNPRSSAVLRKGKLYVDDAQIDEFNVVNQYFQ